MWATSWALIVELVRTGMAAPVQAMAVAMNSSAMCCTPATAPSRGPTAVPASWAEKIREMARPRFSIGTLEDTRARLATSTAPAAPPWTNRSAMNPHAESGRMKARQEAA